MTRRAQRDGRLFFADVFQISLKSKLFEIIGRHAYVASINASQVCFGFSLHCAVSLLETSV